MVTIARCFQILILVFLCASLHAKDLNAYNVGDTADADIAAPVAFDSIDPVATAAKKSEEAAKTPVVFRYFPLQTNDVVQAFQNLYDDSHKKFLEALNQKFQTSTLDDSIIASQDFTDVLAAFNKKNKNFPLPAGLAKAWAKNSSDAAIKSRLMGYLGEGLRRPITADEFPPGVQPGETIRLITLKKDETLTLDDAQKRGHVGGMELLRKMSAAKGILRRQFPQDEQATGRALGSILKTNCIIDEDLTKQARDAAAAQIAVPVHYDVGQMIVRQGETVDEKIKAALDQLAKNTAAVQLMNEQAKKAQEQAAAAQQQAQAAQAQAQKITQQATVERQQIAKFAQQSRSRETVLFAEIGGVSAFAIVAVVIVFYAVSKSRQMKTSAPAASNGAPVASSSAAIVAEKKLPQIKINIPTANASSPMPAALAKTTSLSEAQTFVQMAEAEILQLSQRLDKIYAPPHDRLRTYQLRLEDFERELSQHGVQNPELIKLKIVALQRQMEAERKRFHL